MPRNRGNRAPVGRRAIPLTKDQAEAARLDALDVGSVEIQRQLGVSERTLARWRKLKNYQLRATFLANFEGKTAEELALEVQQGALLLARKCVEAALTSNNMEFIRRTANTFLDKGALHRLNKLDAPKEVSINSIPIEIVNNFHDEEVVQEDENVVYDMEPLGQLDVDDDEEPTVGNSTN